MNKSQSEILLQLAQGLTRLNAEAEALGTTPEAIKALDVIAGFIKAVDIVEKIIKETPQEKIYINY